DSVLLLSSQTIESGRVGTHVVELSKAFETVVNSGRQWGVLASVNTASPTQVIRFGVFEVDLRAGELRKQGAKVKLQEQPFQVLQALLEKPGEIVTREELRKRIWPSDTFVDFDGGVNNAIKRLREALGDRADTPRFIETLPRRGYRFIAPVDGSSAATPTGQESPTREGGSAVSRRRLRI